MEPREVASERPNTSGKDPSPGSLGSLLRLFRSDFFDARLHMYYLLRMEQPGVQDYLVNELYKMGDDDVDFYLPELCQLALLRFKTSSLHRFLLDKAGQSVHFALKILLLMQSFVEDRTPDIWESALSMVNGCETAIVNSSGDSFSAERFMAVSPADGMKSDNCLVSTGHPVHAAHAAGGTAQPPPLVDVGCLVNGKLAPDETLLATQRLRARVNSCPRLHLLDDDSSEDDGAQAPLAPRSPQGTSATPSRSGSGFLSETGPADVASVGGASASVEFAPERQHEGRSSTKASLGSVQRMVKVKSCPALRPVASVTAPTPPPTPSRSGLGEALRHLSTCIAAASVEAKALACGLTAPLPNAFLALGAPAKALGIGSSKALGVEVEMQRFMLKQRRCDYFNMQNHFVLFVIQLSKSLVALKGDRLSCLRQTLVLLNRWLLERRLATALGAEAPLSLMGLHVPIGNRRDSRRQILRICPELCRVFSTATRAPFLLVFESANLDEGEDLDDPAMNSNAASPGSQLVKGSAKPAAQTSEPHGFVRSISPAHELLSAGLVAELAAAATRLGLMSDRSDGNEQEYNVGTDLQVDHHISWPQTGTSSARRDSKAVSWAALPTAQGERSSVLELRRLLLRFGTVDLDGVLASTVGVNVGASVGSAASPSPSVTAVAIPGKVTPVPVTIGRSGSGGYASTALSPTSPVARDDSLVVEGGPERARSEIWGEPWEQRVARIRAESPYGHYRSWNLESIFVKGGDDLRQELLAAQVIKQFRDIFLDAKLPLWLLEVEVLVTSASSGITSFIRDSNTIDNMKKNYPGKSLADIFKLTFADRHFEATRNFIESYAAYSLVVWFLQVKDRHNGNLMMLSSGHVVHIDFGFMLSNSPGGNMAFEQSPFMLTQEVLDVMEGEYSVEYDYFRSLIIRGFLEARKQVERIALPVRMMVAGGSRMPCFREGGEWVLKELQDRFFVCLTEEACIDKILELIDTSVNNWRTVAYHNIQRFTHGIL